MGDVIDMDAKRQSTCVECSHSWQEVRICPTCKAERHVLIHSGHDDCVGDYLYRCADCGSSVFMISKLTEDGEPIATCVCCRSTYEGWRDA